MFEKLCTGQTLDQLTKNNFTPKKSEVLATFSDPERRFHVKPGSETRLLAVFFNFVFAVPAKNK